MMKPLFKLSVLFFILAACSPQTWHSNTSKDVYNYARKVERKPLNIKFNDRLQLAYREQKDRLLLEIESLKQQKRPFYWEKVHDKYNELNKMSWKIQDCAECLNKITPVFYESEQLAALENATDERIEAGLLALGLNTKAQAQRAYYSFMKAKKLSPQRRDIDSLIIESIDMGTMRVILEGDDRFERSYVREIERDFFRSLPRFSEVEPFFRFYSPEDAERNRIRPDYVIKFGYDYMRSGFEQRNCSEETFTKEIKVGEKKIDSVKVEPIYEKVSGKVVKCIKSLKSEGSVWFKVVDYQYDNVILRDDFYDEDTWISEWVTVSGDSRALPAGAANSGIELYAPSVFLQYDHINDDLSYRVSQRIREFIRRQNALASN